MFHYFSGLIERDLKLLFWHRFFALTSATLIGSFGVMFSYEVSGSLLVPILLFLIPAVVPMFFYAHGNFLLKNIGMRNSIIIGESFSILSWLFFFLTTPDNYMLMLSLAVVAMCVTRVFYWVPHNVLFALLTSETNRARSVAFVSICHHAAELLLPVAAGLLIAVYGFNFIYAIGIVFALMGIVPLAMMTNRRAELSWSPKEIWQKTLGKKYRSYALSEFFQGIELAIAVVLWPLVIYLLVAGDTVEVGLITSGSTLFLIIFNFFLARFMDRYHNHAVVLKYFSWMLSMSWALRIFVETASDIFFSSVFGRITKSGVELPMKTIEFDIAGDEKNMEDEMTIIREIALNAGRAVGFICIAIAVFFFEPKFLFIFAAIAVLCLNFIARQHTHKPVK